MHFRKYKIWAKVSKLSLKRIGFLFLMILVSFGAFGQKQSKKVRQAQKKYEKSEEQKKIDYEKARKKSFPAVNPLGSPSFGSKISRVVPG